MFRFAALKHPEHADAIARVLAIPPTRFDKTLITDLTDPELDALLASPDRHTWIGRRDHALILLAAQTGLRAAELTGLTIADIHLASGPHVSCHGKARKRQITPPTRQTAAVLRAWLAEYAGPPTQPLFPTNRGTRLSRDALDHRLTKHAARATDPCPTPKPKTITPHILRHTAAMRLLHAGVDTAAIAL